MAGFWKEVMQPVMTIPTQFKETETVLEPQLKQNEGAGEWWVPLYGTFLERSHAASDDNSHTVQGNGNRNGYKQNAFTGADIMLGLSKTCFHCGRQQAEAKKRRPDKVPTGGRAMTKLLQCFSHVWMVRRCKRRRVLQNEVSVPVAVTAQTGMEPRYNRACSSLGRGVLTCLACMT
jgi:hypothetical protein